jgi:hypothetical protein
MTVRSFLQYRAVVNVAEPVMQRDRPWWQLPAGLRSPGDLAVLQETAIPGAPAVQKGRETWHPLSAAGRYRLSSACFRSAIKSRTSSIPVEYRIRPSGIPMAARSWAVHST